MYSYSYVCSGLENICENHVQYIPDRNQFPSLKLNSHDVLETGVTAESNRV